MKKYTKDNMILIERKYALNQLRELCTLILKEQGYNVRVKSSIKAAYPYDRLDVDWFRPDFNDKRDKYRVVFEHNTNSYSITLYMTLKIQDYVYDKSTDRFYDLCNIRVWSQECNLQDCKTPTETDLTFNEISEIHESAMNGYYSTRSKPINRFVLTTNCGQGIEEADAILKRSLIDFANKFNLTLSEDIDLIVNEKNRFTHSMNNGIYYNYSRIYLTQGENTLQCNISFKSLPTHNKENIAIDLVCAEITPPYEDEHDILEGRIGEVYILDPESGCRYSSYGLELELNKLLLKHLKNTK